MQALSQVLLLGLLESKQVIVMSSDRIRTQHMSMARRYALWGLVTCAVAVAAFALAWNLRSTGDSRRDEGDEASARAKACTDLTAKLDSAEARVSELAGANASCAKRKINLESCLAKQLECEKAVKEGGSKLASAEAERAGALSEKSRVVAKAGESQREVNESIVRINKLTDRINKLTADSDLLRRQSADQRNRLQSAYSELKSRFDKACTDCGSKCKTTCSR